MSKGAAVEKKLGALHDKLADVFLHGLDGEVLLDGEGEEVVVPPSPQLLNAARAFLKDNEIMCVAEADNRVGELENKLQVFRKDAKKRFSDQDNVVPIVSAQNE